MHTTWSDLAARYLAALVVENAYEREHCWVDPSLPIGPERSAAVDAIPREHMAEAERLQSSRLDIEDALLARPSPDATGFALKVLICRGDGRDLNGHDDMLAAEARAIFMGELG